MLDLNQRRRVAALMKARRESMPGELQELLARESDLDVLRQANYQFARWAGSAAGRLLTERIAQLTGRRPQDGREPRAHCFRRKGAVRA